MASPVLSVQKHTLTITNTSTSPTDVTFIADTPPNVQITDGTGTSLPSMVVGERFMVVNHDAGAGEHNGVYEVVTVNTDQEDYLVESITGDTGAATGEAADIYTSISDQASLTGSPTTANCIPFVTTRVSTVAGTNPNRFSAYAVQADFVGGDTVRVFTSGRDTDERTIVCEVTVVEFNPSEVNVYQGSSGFDGESFITLNDPYGADVNVVLAKSFLYFTYSGDHATERWDYHNIRGVMTDEDTLTFDQLFASNQDPEDDRVSWYVAEAINTAWAVDHVAIQITGAQTTNTDTFTAVGDTAKTFVLGSYMGADGTTDTDGNRQNTIDVELTNSTTVTATRLAVDGIIDWAGFVVELAGNENVYRGQLTTTQASPDPAGHTSIGATVTAANSMVHTCGMTGVLGGSGNDGGDEDDVPAVFYSWTFFSDTQIDCEHYTGQASFEAADVTWEVIEWDVGGAAPPRRVMVVS